MFFSGKNHKEQKIEQLLLENYNKYYRLAYSYVHHEADAAVGEFADAYEVLVLFLKAPGGGLA